MLSRLKGIIRGNYYVTLCQISITPSIIQDAPQCHEGIKAEISEVIAVEAQTARFFFSVPRALHCVARDARIIEKFVVLSAPGF